MWGTRHRRYSPEFRKLSLFLLRQLHLVAGNEKRVVHSREGVFNECVIFLGAEQNTHRRVVAAGAIPEPAFSDSESNLAGSVCQIEGGIRVCMAQFLNVRLTLTALPACAVIWSWI